MDDYDDLGRHEGYAAYVLADGTLSSTTTGAPGGGSAVVVMLYDAEGNYTGEDQIRPAEEVVGWQVCCSCIPSSVSDAFVERHGYSAERETWLGSQWRRVATQAEEDLSRRLVYPGSGEGDIHAAEREDVEALMVEEWRAHIEPDLLAGMVRAAAADAAKANERLDDTVRGAHDAGLSWEAIGRAVGITRQSAHERWRRR